jgi:hypothetical protein
MFNEILLPDLTQSITTRLKSISRQTSVYLKRSLLDDCVKVFFPPGGGIHDGWGKIVFRSGKQQML